MIHFACLQMLVATDLVTAKTLIFVQIPTVTFQAVYSVMYFWLLPMFTLLADGLLLHFYMSFVVYVLL